MSTTLNFTRETAFAEKPVHTTASARWALAALALATLLSSLGTSIANVALPVLAREFAASFHAVQWIVLAYLLAITALIVGVGRLGDLLGPRQLFLGGIVLFTLASGLCGAAPTLWLLIVGRGIQGIGAAIMMALTLTFVRDAVAPEQTGRAMGLLGTMSAIGTALGPTLGGFLISAWGWRAIFFALSALAALTWFPARRFLPRDRVLSRVARVGFDAWGMLLLALALSAYAAAMTMGRGGFDSLTLMLLSSAAVGAGLFVLVESRSASPLVDLALLRDGDLRASLATTAIVSTVVMATLVVGPFHLSRSFGLAAREVGMVLSAGPLAAALTGVPAGLLVDRFGAPRVILFGLAGMMAGCVALSLIPVTFGTAGYLVPLVAVTVSYALFQAANNTAVMGGASRERRGVVSGLLNLARNLGLVTGASLMGAIFALAAGTSNPTTAPVRDVARGTQVTLGIAAVMLVAALTLALKQAERHRKPDTANQNRRTPSTP